MKSKIYIKKNMQNKTINEQYNKNKNSILNTIAGDKKKKYISFFYFNGGSHQMDAKNGIAPN